ncbi:MAG: hypothetical protein RR403_00560 [Pseudoflavonifractor sp.]
MAELDEKLGAILGNRAAMEQIVSIAKAFSGGAEPAAAEAEDQSRDEGSMRTEEPENPLGMLGSLDPKLVKTALTLFSEYSAVDDDKVALLQALRPFLKEERWAKMEEAVQIAKLSRVIRVAFQLFGKEAGEPDV